MGTEIMKRSQDKQVAVSTEEMALVKSIVFPDATNDELKLYLYECRRRGVHPLDRMIYPIKRNDKDSGKKRITFQTSIDYLRSASSEDGDNAGMDEPVYGPENPQGFPEWARVVVYKYMTLPNCAVERVPFPATARWAEYYPGEKMGFMWRQKPYLMLGKCAEALARRLAWPSRLDGLYAEEEMHIAANDGSAGAPGSLAGAVTEVSHTKGAKLIENGNGGPKAELQALLDEMYPNRTDQAGVLRQLSITSIARASEAVCRGAIERLKKGSKEAPADDAGSPECTKDPGSCNSASFIDDSCVCTVTNEPCPHYFD